MIEMDISNQRHPGLLPDTTEGLGRFHTGHGDTQNVCTRIFKTPDLCHGCLNVTGFRICHTLDGYRGITTNRHSTHHHLACLSPFDCRLCSHLIITSYLPKVTFVF
jgi:hypothetical protein